MSLQVTEFDSKCEEKKKNSHLFGLEMAILIIVPIIF